MIQLPSSFTVSEFTDFVAREDEGLELKTGISRKRVAESMVAFTNSHGGVILIGVRDDRTVAGRRRDQGVDDDIHGAALTAHNLGRYEIGEVFVHRQPLVSITVRGRTDAAAQTSDGRVLVRRGSSNTALFGHELLEFLANRSLQRFEATDSQVSTEKVSKDRSAALAKAFGWHGSALPDRWRERGLLHDSGSLTIAGALVLTDPAESIRAAKFHVDIRSYERAIGTSYVRRELIGGSVQEQVERATDLVSRDIGTEMVVTGAFRHDVSRLPRRVIRETVANAVAHRSYDLDASPVVIELRPDRVAITSPGQLPEPVTVETLRQGQAPRNHTVIDVLRRFGLAEDSGQGIDVMQDDMRSELLDEPVFIEEAHSFRVELPLGGLVSTTERAWLAEYERAGTLRAEERMLLLTLLRDGRVTNARARDVIGVDSTDARSRMHRLRDAGILVQHGTRGRAYYTLGTLGPERSYEQVVLEAAAEAPMTNQRVRGLTGLDRIAALQLLRRLVAEGRLVQRGKKRGTTYQLPQRRTIKTAVETDIALSIGRGHRKALTTATETDAAAPGERGRRTR